jgi:hypothetical protein
MTLEGGGIEPGFSSSYIISRWTIGLMLWVLTTYAKIIILDCLEFYSIPVCEDKVNLYILRFFRGFFTIVRGGGGGATIQV